MRCLRRNVFYGLYTNGFGNIMTVRSPHRLVVVRLLRTQLAITLLLPLALMPFGTIAALSAAAGGIACLVPNAYFASRAFRYSGARSAMLILNSFYSGQAMKIVLTAIIFSLIFIYLKPLNAGALFGGFVLVQSVIWITPWLSGRHKDF